MRNGHVKIVLPCANEEEWLRLTVESILEHTDYPEYEIVVSANGDTKTDFSFIGEPGFRRRCSLTVSKRLLGVGNSMNVAVAPGDAAYYVFLDAHCLVEQRDWLDRVVACLEAHPEACMVQPEVRNFIYDGTAAPGEHLDPARVRANYVEYYIRWAWPFSNSWRLVESITDPVSTIEPFEGMAGAGMAIFCRSEVFHRLDGFDREVGGWYYEALDYCVHGWLVGHPMLVDPTVYVLHRTKTETPQVPRLTDNIVHGILRTAYKYLSPRRRDIAELLFRQHGFGVDVHVALERIRRGRWLEERVAYLKERVLDDDGLFSRFEVYEPRFDDNPYYAGFSAPPRTYPFQG